MAQKPQKPKTPKAATARLSNKEILERRQNHSRISKEDVPQPGFYYNPGFLDKNARKSGVPCAHFGKVHTSRSLIPKPDAPGPGFYEQIIPFGSNVSGVRFSSYCNRDSTSYSVNTRLRSATAGPGPATYDTSKFGVKGKPGGPSVYFGRYVHRKDTESCSPGPAAYAPPELPSKGAQGARFAKAPRVTGVDKATARPDEPGPNQYDPLTFKPLGKFGIRGVMAGKPMSGGRPITSTIHSIDGPGPGQYSGFDNIIDKRNIRGGTWKFGTCARFKENASTY